MELFFSVQYRKLQGRKHKSWEEYVALLVLLSGSC